jgi:hypothetical protein
MSPQARRRLVWAVIGATVASFLAVDFLYLLLP